MSDFDGKIEFEKFPPAYRLMIKYIELENRINRAIEYIHLYTTQRKYFISYTDELKNEKPTFNGDVRKLLDILKGSDSNG